MKHTRKNNSDTQVTLTVTLDAADLAKLKPKTLGRLSKKLKVPGFREGKVPTKVAEKNINPNTLAIELAEDAINDAMVQLLAREKLQPLDQPKVDISKHIPGELIEFTANIEILPEVTLGDYKNLKVARDAAKVAAKDIDEVIQRMRQGMADKKPVERAAKEGDEVSIDFEGTQDGKAVAGASGKGYPLVLGSGTFIPGFEEAVIGKKTGDNFTKTLTFPKDYQHKPLAGAKVDFAITINEVKEVVLPEVNAEFAAKSGPFKTVDELRADVKRELTDQHEREALDKLKDQLLEQLINGSTIPTPEILIQDQIAGLERDFTQNLLYRGITLPQYLEEQKLSKEEWQEKELRPQAIRRVQVGLALAKLSKLENIEVGMDELNQRLAQLLQQYGGDTKLREQLDTPEARRDIANRLATEKTVDRLVELNQG